MQIPPSSMATKNTPIKLCLYSCSCLQCHSNLNCRNTNEANATVIIPNDDGIRRCSDRSGVKNCLFLYSLRTMFFPWALLTPRSKSLELGRSIRIFTAAQAIALLWAGVSKPESWRKSILCTGSRDLMVLCLVIVAIHINCMGPVSPLSDAACLQLDLQERGSKITIPALGMRTNLGAAITLPERAAIVQQWLQCLGPA
ncbi:hypothetical protein BDZ91DRAFT_745979 [Kalaharituber pfeilii]|nr:hypothetical protein BDZ91DRAFT_745979 [Kalaharituber pfeilii]